MLHCNLSATACCFTADVFFIFVLTSHSQGLFFKVSTVSAPSMLFSGEPVLQETKVSTRVSETPALGKGSIGRNALLGRMSQEVPGHPGQEGGQQSQASVRDQLRGIWEALCQLTPEA